MKYCIANWKMNFRAQEGVEFVNSLLSKDLKKDDKRIILCPSFPSLFKISDQLNGSVVQLGAQNMYHEESGAYTGEISSDMLKEADCQWVILGHSERRHVLGETNEMIQKKFNRAIQDGLGVILCIGEKIDERESGSTELILREQLSTAFLGYTDQNSHNILIAYEPVWAIGTNKTATLKIIEDTHEMIMSILNELKLLDNEYPILYGGSVNDKNAAKLSKIQNVDGFLIGGASLDVEKFYNIYLNI